MCWRRGLILMFGDRGLEWNKYRAVRNVGCNTGCVFHVPVGFGACRKTSFVKESLTGMKHIELHFICPPHP